MSVSEHIADSLRRDIVTAMKESIGFNDNIAESLSGDFLARLQEKWGGRKIYIPAIDSKSRNANIKAEFTGDNHVAICKKYGVSLSTLYRVTK